MIPDENEQKEENKTNDDANLEPTETTPVPDTPVQDKPAITDNEDLISEVQDEPAITDSEVLDKNKLDEKPSPVPSEEVKEGKPLEEPHVQDNPAIVDNKYLKSDKEKVEQDELTPEQKAIQLTEEELDAARKLWAKKHIAQAQKISNQHRHERMVQRMNEIETLVKANPNSTVHQLANKMSLSEKLTSGYLQKLVHAGRIKATGNTNNRRFS